MLLELAPQWKMDLDRGPDWLFVRLRPPIQGDCEEIPLAEMISKKLDPSFCNRLVLELDNVKLLRSWMIDELLRLHKRLENQGGTLRLCGLSKVNEEALRACQLLNHFPPYANRHDAVMGQRPQQPR